MALPWWLRSGGEHIAIDRTMDFGWTAIRKFFSEGPGKKFAETHGENAAKELAETFAMHKRCRPLANDLINIYLPKKYGKRGVAARKGFREARSDRLHKRPLSYDTARHYKANDENRLSIELSRKVDAYLDDDDRKKLTVDLKEIVGVEEMLGPAFLRLGLLALEDRGQFDDEVQVEKDDTARQTI